MLAALQVSDDASKGCIAHAYSTHSTKLSMLVFQARRGMCTINTMPVLKPLQRAYCAGSSKHAPGRLTLAGIVAAGPLR